MQVDESRSYGQSVTGNRLSGSPFDLGADLYNPVVFDCDITRKSWFSRAINDRSPFEQDVKRRLILGKKCDDGTKVKK